MKLYIPILLIFVALLINASFNQVSEKNLIKNQLLGRWELDSLSVPTKIIVNARKSERSLNIHFFNDKKFSLDWWHGDVGNSYEGTYEICKNPKRGCYTLVLIPDLMQINSEKIRQYLIYDILEIEGLGMILAEETRFLERSRKDGSTYRLKYNRRNYMRKIISSNNDK